MAFRALIFDMDGTIVDNMRYHDDAWEIWHHKHGLPFDRATFFSRTAGKTNSEILNGYFPGKSPEELVALSEDKESLYEAAYKPHVTAMPGLVELMAKADAAHAPMAVATAAPPRNIAVILDPLGIRDRFRTIVSPSQGYRGKPNPDVFLVAAERMGVKPADCLVFEDAPNGIEAARRAGMKAVAMTTMLPAAAFSHFGNVIACAHDFSELDADALLGKTG